MFDYKFVFTILAMATFTYGAAALVGNKIDVATVLMAVGSLLIFIEAIIIVLAGKPLLAQIVQWFFEVSVFCFSMAYSTISNHLKEGVYMLVAGVVTFLVFLALVVCVEMAKINASSQDD